MATFYMDLVGGSDTAIAVDSSTTARMLNAVGSAGYTSAQSKFGGSCLDLSTASSTSGISADDSADWLFGAGQFTVEGWVRFNNVGACSFISQFGNSPQFGWYFGMDDSTHIVFYYSTTGSDLLGTPVAWTPSANTWYHVAADRDASNVLRVYVDGVVKGSATVGSTFINNTAQLVIGNDDRGIRKIDGWVDEVRVTKGVARYAGAFTAPTAAFPDSVGAGDASFASVVLLAHLNTVVSGAAFGTRWKTFASGATAARTAPGDTIRIMSSTNPTSIGNATWTQNSKTITLASAVTLNISDCETAWTASANVTSTADTSQFKENTKSAKHVIAGAFTTGLCAYFATGTLNLSGYQQVSFWVYATAAITANTLSLRLCTDTAGATSVHTIPLPPTNQGSVWLPVTVDLGTNMNSAIQSVALYQDVDIAAVTVQVDNIIACKASSSADSLSLTSLIGKVWNLNWTASTAYASNDLRKPTPPNRNGYRYKVTAGGGGNSGSTEPTWPLEIGATVTDGALTWTCDDLEDTWYGIQSINGTTVKLDNGPQTLGNAGRGYGGSTETVATYKRETIKQAMVSAFTAFNIVQEGGTSGSPITYSGGWNTTDMSTQTGETWIDGQDAYFNSGFNANTSSYLVFDNLNSVRCYTGFSNLYSFTYCIVKNCHANNTNSSGIATAGTSGSAGPSSFLGIAAHNGDTLGILLSSTMMQARALSAYSNISQNISLGGGSSQGMMQDFTAKNSGAYGLYTQSGPVFPVKISRLVTASNVSAGAYASAGLILFNSSLTDTTAYAPLTSGVNAYLYSQKDGGTATSHVITTDGGTIISATDQRHTGSGIAWKFRPTATSRTAVYPLTLSVAKIALSANNLVTLSIWTRRDNTNINGKLLVQGGQIAGVPSDVSVACAPTINTWTQSSNLTFTPSEAGVVEVLFQVYDGVGTSNNFWIDDISITQA
jgi:hypothetical protein